MFATAIGHGSATMKFSRPVIDCVETRARTEPNAPHMTAEPNPSLPRRPRCSSPAAQNAPAKKAMGPARPNTPPRGTPTATAALPRNPPRANRIAARVGFGLAFGGSGADAGDASPGRSERLVVFRD